MKCIQAVVLFGLVAVLTFQVERSSAAPLQYELDFDLSEDFFKDEHLFATTDSIKEGLEKLRESVNKGVEKIKIGPVTKEVAERLVSRITRLRDAVNSIADILPDTQLGALAKKIVAEFEAAINTVREVIKGVNPQTDGRDVAVAGRDYETGCRQIGIVHAPGSTIKIICLEVYF